MASQAYHDWLADGEPVKYGRAVRAVGDKLTAHGYTVYYKGDTGHLQHEPPEDHTPYSATGWPGKSPYPYVMAADVMPPASGQKSKLTGQPLPSLQKLSAQLIADKKAGHSGAAFLKYINHEPEGDYTGPCYHESWQPDYKRISSSDRGHIHLSSRSDFATSGASDGYDLVARVMGEEDDDMAGIEEFYHSVGRAATDDPKETAADRYNRDMFAYSERFAHGFNPGGGTIASKFGEVIGSLNEIKAAQQAQADAVAALGAATTALAAAIAALTARIPS